MRTQLTPRSKIAVRWSTDPALVGYCPEHLSRDSELKKFRSQRPDAICTVRTLRDTVYKIRQLVGISTFIRFEFTVCKTGESISLDDVDNAEFDFEYDKLQEL